MILGAIAVVGALTCVLCAFAYVPVRRTMTKAYEVWQQAEDNQVQSACKAYCADNQKQRRLGLFACIGCVLTLFGVEVFQATVALMFVGIGSLALVFMFGVAGYFNDKEYKLYLKARDARQLR